MNRQSYLIIGVSFACVCSLTVSITIATNLYFLGTAATTQSACETWLHDRWQAPHKLRWNKGVNNSHKNNSHNNIDLLAEIIKTFFRGFQLLVCMRELYDAYVCVCICVDVRTYPQRNKSKSGESGIAKKNVSFSDMIHTLSQGAIWSWFTAISNKKVTLYVVLHTQFRRSSINLKW